MNSNIYEYGTDPKTGLPRRLVRDTIVIQEVMDSNPLPSAVVHLRLQTYIESTGVTVSNPVYSWFKWDGDKVSEGAFIFDPTEYVANMPQ